MKTATRESETSQVSLTIVPDGGIETLSITLRWDSKTMTDERCHKIFNYIAQAIYHSCDTYPELETFNRQLHEAMNEARAKDRT